MSGLLWAFGIPLFVLGPMLAVPAPPRPPRPPQLPMTAGQRRLRRRVFITAIALLVLILAPGWARVALLVAAVMVIALVVTWWWRRARR